MTIADLREIVGFRPFLFNFLNEYPILFQFTEDGMLHDLSDGATNKNHYDSIAHKEVIGNLLDWFETPSQPKACICIGAPARTCPEHGIDSIIAA